MKRHFGNICLLTAGAVCFALSLTLFLDPASIVTGGVSGIAILVSHMVPIGVGALFLLLNIPPLAVGIYAFGKRFMAYTLYATLLSSLLAELAAFFTAPLLPLTDDPVLSSLFGGALCGAGLGLIFRAGGTTGGTDIGVKLLRLKFPLVKEGRFFFVIDFSVVLASAIVFRSFESALYSTLALIACSVSVDTVLYGKPEERLLFIVSRSPKTLAERLMKDCGVGVTLLAAEGGYLGKENTILFCAVRAKSYSEVAEVVAEEDPFAFTVVTTAKEIYGEGFRHYPTRQKKKWGA